MDKMKVNKQLTMKEKGNRSSSHYRNSSGLSEVATKFVTWETNPLERLAESKVYQLRVKLNKGGLVSLTFSPKSIRAVAQVLMIARYLGWQFTTMMGMIS